MASETEIAEAAKAMQRSKAWPAVFQAGAARLLAKVAIDTVDAMRRNAAERSPSDMLTALKAANGYLLNAKIDLETGAPKRTAIRTIEGGLNVIEAAIAAAVQPEAAP